MTQPRFTPIETRDEVRPAKHLDPPRRWTPHRPAEHRRDDGDARRSRIGVAGPDQGYALRLAESVRDSVVLGPGEHIDDALAIATQVALRRASLFGRAPVKSDLQVAVALLSYGSALSDEAVGARRSAVTGVSHDLWRCREIAAWFDDDAIAESVDRAPSRAIDWTSAAPS